MSRFVRPESEKLDLSAGDWLLVKRRLNAGEQRAAFAATVKRMVVNEPTELEPEALGLARMVAFLLDWSLRDEAGGIVPIRDQPAGVVKAALLALDPESFREIHDAIMAHELRQVALLDEEKKRTDGGSRLLVISKSAE
jgi:hypothetical protein